jgi:hypothetical protein
MVIDNQVQTNFKQKKNRSAHLRVNRERNIYKFAANLSAWIMAK